MMNEDIAEHYLFWMAGNLYLKANAVIESRAVGCIRSVSKFHLKKLNESNGVWYGFIKNGHKTKFY